MQVNQIQRPLLIEPFFDKELTPDNSYVSYIDCSIKSSSVVHKKSVTSNSHNIKKPLKEKNYNRFIDNPLIKRCPVFPMRQSSDCIIIRSDNSKSLFFIDSDVSKYKDYYKLHDSFSIFDVFSAVA